MSQALFLGFHREVKISEEYLQCSPWLQSPQFCKPSSFGEYSIRSRTHASRTAYDPKSRPFFTKHHLM
jgi:hypothetical protein